MSHADAPSEAENDFSLSDNNGHDDSFDNVNHGTPTKRGDTSGSSSSTKSTPSPGNLTSHVPVRSSEISVSHSYMGASDLSYLRGVNDSHAADYDPYLKAVEENASYASDNSKDVIKVLDFGASVEYHHDDLDIILGPTTVNNKSPNTTLQESREDTYQSPQLTTPPRKDRAFGHQYGASSPSGLPNSGLKPPVATSPTSPELSGRSSSFNKTPSRIPLPSSRGQHSGTRVSPTQDRSKSKFADALRRHGREDSESESDAVAPLNMSKTVAVDPVRRDMTPQTKFVGDRPILTPGTHTGSKPPTPAPTPLQLPPSRAVVGADTAGHSGHQRPETAAFTEGYDEVTLPTLNSIFHCLRYFGEPNVVERSVDTSWKEVLL